MSFSLTTFTKKGQLQQLEFALVAVGQGETALGIKAKDGVVLATEKKASSVLIDETSVQKIQATSDHAGLIYSGLGSDFRKLVDLARKEASKYEYTYNENMPIKKLCNEIAMVCQIYTQSGGVRPFGVSLLLGGWDYEGPSLYQIDPSGAYFGWKATAIGKNMVSAKTFLEKRYSPELEMHDAIHMALLTLKEGFEGEMNEFNTEVGIVSKSNPVFKVLSPAELKDYLNEME